MMTKKPQKKNQNFAAKNVISLLAIKNSDQPPRRVMATPVDEANCPGADPKLPH